MKPSDEAKKVVREIRIAEMQVREAAKRGPEISFAGHYRQLVAAEDEAAALVIDRALSPAMYGFQQRVASWMLQCFTPAIAADKLERSDRFIEEALELVQAGGYSADRAHALVDYVFGRHIGELSQEVGGVMVTLAALCEAHGVDMIGSGETELARILAPEIILKIRAKQASKPVGSALPIPSNQPTADAATVEALERLRIMAKQKLSSEMDDEDLERADWRGGYDAMCQESRLAYAAIRQLAPGNNMAKSGVCKHGNAPWSCIECDPPAIERGDFRQQGGG